MSINPNCYDSVALIDQRSNISISQRNKDEEKIVSVALRSDFCSFINKVFDTINPGDEYEFNWHIELIAQYLEAVRNGDIKRLIINIPPRGLKSVCTSVAWPAWLLGHDSTKRILAASYSNVLAIKHSLDCRLVLNSDWYKETFSNTVLSKKHNQKTKFLTTNNGFRFATSVGGSVTGEGGEYLIVDDPHNPIHINSFKMRSKVIQWFEQTFLTRLNNKNTGAVIVIMQRLHEEDLCGHLLSNSKSWELLKLPVQAQKTITFGINNKEYLYEKGQVLHDSRDKEEYLSKLEAEIGVHNYAAQYLQDPISQHSSMLKLEEINFYETLPEKFDYVIQSWDTAIKISENADYSVCTIFGILDKHYYLISMMRKKLTYPELKNEVNILAKKYSPKYILIEDKASGQQLIQDLRIDNLPNIIPIKPQFDKITRFASSLLAFQAGQVLFPQKSSLNAIIIKELTSFPNSKHDDIVDSISQFINFIKLKSTRSSARLRKL